MIFHSNDKLPEGRYIHFLTDIALEIVLNASKDVIDAKQAQQLG